MPLHTRWFPCTEGLADAFEALGTRRAIAEASGKRTPSRRDVLLRSASRRKFASKLFRLSIQGFRLRPPWLKRLLDLRGEASLRIRATAKPIITNTPKITSARVTGRRLSQSQRRFAQ